MKKLKLIKGDRRSVQGVVFTSTEFTEVPDDFPSEKFEGVLTDKDIVPLREPKPKKKRAMKKLDENKVDSVEEEKDIDAELIE